MLWQWKRRVLHKMCVWERERESVALVIQQEMCFRHTCGLPRCTIFSTLSHKLHDFRKKIIEHKTCVLIFGTTFGTTFNRKMYHSKKNWARCDHIRILVCLLLLSDINKIWIFWTVSRKIRTYQTLWQSVEWEQSSSICADKQMDRELRRS
jgi:hypothetical protein